MTSAAIRHVASRRRRACSGLAAAPISGLHGRRPQRLTGKGGFEVWIADQSDTRPGFGGQLLIYEGSDLTGKKAAQRDADRAARSGRGHRRSVPGGDRQKPRAPAHDLVQQRAHARGAVLRRQRTCRDLRCRGAQAAELLRDDRRQHQDASGARGVSRAGRLVHPRRQPERQAARAHRHQLHDQHVHAQRRRHARSDDLHDAERAAVRAPRSAAHQLADLSDHRFEQPLWRSSRCAAAACSSSTPRPTPMAIVGEYDKATVKGNGCGGVEVGRHMYINSGGSPVNVSSTDPHHPALYGFDVYRFPLRRLLDVERGQHAGAEAALLEERDVRLARHHADAQRSLPLGDGSARQRRRDPRRSARASG